MNSKPTRRSTFVECEPLESRTLFSAALHSALVPDAKSTAPATTTKLAVHSGTLGQAVTFTVTEKNSGTGGAPVGSVVLTVDDTAFQTLTLSSKSANAKTIKATFTEPAGAGGTPLYIGSHTVSAAFTSSGTLPASSASGTFTVKTPKFKTESGGLGVATITPGHGAALREGETASVFYTGYLASDGSIFDDSDAHPPVTPFQFEISPTGGAIAGFIEGADGMKVGSTRVLDIPSDLGYGAEGSPPTIPANAELVFIVTLEAIS